MPESSFLRAAGRLPCPPREVRSTALSNNEDLKAAREIFLRRYRRAVRETIRDGYVSHYPGMLKDIDNCLESLTVLTLGNQDWSTSAPALMDPSTSSPSG